MASDYLTYSQLSPLYKVQHVSTPQQLGDLGSFPLACPVRKQIGQYLAANHFITSGYISGLGVGYNQISPQPFTRLIGLAMARR